VGRIQERYGITKEEAAKQVKEWNEAANRNVDDVPRRRAS
jgi:uncharacterized protein YjbJ (UPF0337 family)